MTNYEIVTILKKFREQIRGHEEVLTNLRAVASSIDSVMELLAGISSFDGKQNNHFSGLQDNLHNVHKDLKRISTLDFFKSTTELSVALKSVLMVLPAMEGPMLKLLRDLIDLREAYDSYTREHSTNSVLGLVLKSNKFFETLDFFELFSDATCSAIANDEELVDDSEILALYMPSTLTFEEFISRLNSINEIYDELCQIFDISTSEYPLRIIKVESGSLWTKLFGNSKVIALMDDLLRESAKFIHRNYTKEGKAAAIPTSLKTMDEVLEFSNKLKAAGVDVADIHDQLAKGTLLISKNLNSLYSNQPSVVINGETVLLTGERNQKSVGLRDVPKLGRSKPKKIR